MPQKQKLTLEEKVKIVKKYLGGESGSRNAAVEAGVDSSTIRGWIMQYETEGSFPRKMEKTVAASCFTRYTESTYRSCRREGAR